MKRVITSKKFASNVMVSIVAQIISLLVSFVLNLIVPKFIDEYQYAYWQIYVLYIGYVGVLHFGLLDGIVLRYSQYDYDELDKARIRSQFRFLLATTAVITLAITVISLLACRDQAQIIVILVAFGIITKNLFTYSAYTFQITNRINKYAFITIAQKLSYGVFVVVLLALKVNDFYWYCAADLSGDIIGIVLSMTTNRKVYFGKSIGLKDTFKETKINVSSGMILMLANWSALLIVGGAKMVVQWRWQTVMFGKVSFAFSLTNAFLSFVTAISVVLFPSLKRLDPERLPEMYKDIRSILSPLLFCALLVYFPGCWILEKWLPAYAKSLPYFGILLPMIVYSSKVNLLTNNYLKAYRKERAMLGVNALSVALGLIAFIILAVLGNIEALLICIVAVVMFNSVLSEIMVLRTIRVRIIKDFIIEIAMTAAFIVIVQSNLSLWWGCLVYAGVFAAYCAVNYKSIAALLRKIFRRGRAAAPVGNADAESGVLCEEDGADEDNQ